MVAGRPMQNYGQSDTERMGPYGQNYGRMLWGSYGYNTGVAHVVTAVVRGHKGGVRRPVHTSPHSVYTGPCTHVYRQLEKH